MEPGKSRSSILKPQKPRNPLSDLEPAEVSLPVVEFTGRTSSRRVSFASSNFVKEFATDPEKNTILWDTTYEEVLSKSDSTHSSENIHTTHDTQPVVNIDCMIPHSGPTTVSLVTYTEATHSIGSTPQQYICDRNNERKASINFNEQGGEDIESDSSLCDNDHSKSRIVETGNVELLRSVENVNVVKHSVVQVSVLCKERGYINSTNFGAKSVNMSGGLPQTLLPSSTGKENMEFTQICGFAVENESLRDPVDMKLTENFVILDKNKGDMASRTVTKLTQQFPTFNKNSCSGDIQFDKENNNKQYIQQFPLASCELKNLTIVNKNEKGCNPKNKLCEREENIKLTQPLSTFCKSNFDVHQNTVLGDTELDVTQEVIPVYKNFNGTPLDRSKTMEFTQQLSGPYKTNFGIQKSTISGNADVEFTQQLPVLCKNNVHVQEDSGMLGSTRMEFTQQLPVLCKNTFGVQEHTILGNADMEFTQQLPVLCKNDVNVQEDNSMLGSTKMEFTQQLPLLCKSKFGVQENTIVGNADMEFTQQLPVFNQSSYGSRNKTVCSDDNMDFTRQSPALDKTKSDSENKTILGDDDLELTEQLSTAITEHIKPVAQSTVVEGDMEFTQQLPIVNNKSFNIRKDDKEMAQQLLVHNLKYGIDLIDKPIVIGDIESNLNKEINGAPQDKISSFTEQVPIDYNENFNISNIPTVAGDSISSIKREEDIVATENSNKNKSCLIATNISERKFNSLSVQDVDTENKMLEKTFFIDEQQILIVNDGNDNEQKNLTDLNYDKMEVVEESPAMSGHNQNENCSVQNEENVKDICPVAVNKTEVQININQVDVREELGEVSTVKQNPADIKTPGSSFQMTFIPFSPGIDDTQHLINYSLNHKPPKSDFSQIITGDLNPSFLSSKFMPLSGFSIDAFPVSLETTRNNQTYLEHTAVEDNCNTFPESVSSSKTYLQDIDKKCEECNESAPSLLTSGMGNTEATTTMSDGETVNNLKRRSLENIETAVICKKIMLTSEQENKSLNEEGEKMGRSFQESETMNISQENLTLSDSVASVNESSAYISKAIEEVIRNITQTTLSASSTDLNTTKEIIAVHQSPTYNKDLPEVDIRLLSLKQKIEDFKEKTAEFAAERNKNFLILRDLYELEMKEISRLCRQRSFEETKNNIDSSAECSLVESADTSAMQDEEAALVIIESAVTTEVEKVLTLREKILEKEKRFKHYWNLVSLEDDKCKFNTLYKTIGVAVHFHKETGIVTKTEASYNIADESEPEALFVHKIFKNRLSQEVIKSAVGEPYDVLTLLDYVHINMRKCLEILNEFNSFAKRFALEMDHNMRVTFTLVSLTLLSSWVISVDLSDIENVTEDSVTAYARVGTIKEAEIKSFVNSCSRGVSFLKNFIGNITNYLESLEKRKTQIR